MEQTANPTPKLGLVMEGGAMRGMFTAGVLDVLMEQGIAFDGAIGVSAGAAFGCNYKSHQPGRSIRYNMKYCRDRRYCSLYSLITTGNLYGVDLCYKEIPEKLDPFDAKTFDSSPMAFYVVCTDVDTGEAVYHQCKAVADQTLQWIRASASMPLVSTIVEIDGQRLLDGGIADSIPLAWFESAGYEKNLVILTQPRGYVKRPSKGLPLIRRFLGKHPNLVKAMEQRHQRYNQALSLVAQREKEGRVLLLCPPEPLPMNRVERNPKKLFQAYDMGRREAQKHLAAIREFCS